jgi:hypothetical protein
VSGESRSLLSFLAVPVLVADPEGRAVYANPCFETRFGVTSGGAHGLPLARLFEGGAREQVLQAVAAVCDQGEQVRLKLRHGDAGYAAIVSPVIADRVRVGAMVVLCDEPLMEERLVAFHRAIQDPLADLARTLDALLEQTGGRRSERHRVAIEDGLRALERLRKWTDELVAAARAVAGTDGEERFDPAQAARQASARYQREAAAGEVPLDVLLPAGLPRVRGDGMRFTDALLQLLRRRLGASPRPASLTLAAKSVGRGGEAVVLISVTDVPALGQPVPSAQPDDVPPTVREEVQRNGGALHTTADPIAGRTTTMRLRV